MKIMAALLRQGGLAEDIMKLKKLERIEGESPKTAKLGRNDLCYCGSGQKFKNCHGRED
jgi:preprotein translocase subunit SecA